MSIFDKILALSKKIASSILKKQDPVALDETNLFSEEDKNYILNSLTNQSEINKRQEKENLVDAKEAFKKVNEQINVPVRTLTQKRYWFSSAAAILLISFFVSLYLIKDARLQDQSVSNVENNIDIGEDKAILILENGEKVTLNKGESMSQSNFKSNGEAIVYENQHNGSPKNLEFNILSIPRGGQFSLVLSDGTKVWLNSESKLKYPIAFLENNIREIELLYGEIYLDVTPSYENGGMKFRVLNQGQKVEVLGTEFNVRAYKDENSVFTTLVEGKIEVDYSGKKKLLLPEEQYTVNKIDGSVDVKKVDTYNETSWRQGVFSFEDKSLQEIMKVLARWYDMEVVYNNDNIKDIKFNGALNKDQKIVDILTTIKNFKIIENYEIVDKTVFLK